MAKLQNIALPNKKLVIFARINITEIADIKDTY